MGPPSGQHGFPRSSLVRADHSLTRPLCANWRVCWPWQAFTLSASALTATRGRNCRSRCGSAPSFTLMIMIERTYKASRFGAFGPTASSGASRPARRSTYWPRVGQEKQRRSRPDPEARPRQYEALEAAPASTRGCLYRGGQRFESPQLHQEVDVSGPRFPAPTIRRQFSPCADEA